MSEYSEYSVNAVVEGTDVEQTIIVESGIGDIIEKEEWRGEIIGNLFYPVNGNKHKVVLHINGSVPLLQDARFAYSFVILINTSVV